MTIKEYISQKLSAFEISEATLCDMSLSGINLEDEYSSEVMEVVGKGMVSVIEELVLTPRRTNITESGFSESWNYDNLSKYYLWLCRKWGVTPNEDTLALMGTSAIIDKTDIW